MTRHNRRGGLVCRAQRCHAHVEIRHRPVVLHQGQRVSGIVPHDHGAGPPPAHRNTELFAAEANVDLIMDKAGTGLV